MWKSIGSHAVCLFIALAALAATVQAQSSATWVLVDTSTLTLSVMRGNEVLTTFDNISIGSNGTTRTKRVADERTPLGDYRIREIRDSERFHRFLALDYPTLADAEHAVADGRIDEVVLERVRHAWQLGETPPQDTPLGGHLGLHGIGGGSPEIHANFNWTNGCIALTNEQIDALIGQVSVGTRVRIR
jgi:lipoprotein-anchoring transpeptidase ErfK/SrfK